MKVCEVCGFEENEEQENNEQPSTRILHVCENCRTDRDFPYFEHEELQ